MEYNSCFISLLSKQKETGLASSTKKWLDPIAAMSILKKEINHGASIILSLYMPLQPSDKNELLAATAGAIAQLADLMSAVDAHKINTVPYEGSWTAPQLLTHVTKSIRGMAKAMEMKAKPADRDPGQRINELKEVFLDFSKKLQSPEFIVPENGPYERQPTIDQLNESFRQFTYNTNKAELTDLIEGLPLGPITKWEIVHFVLFHTQRHLHQMKRICEALRK